MPHFNWSTFGDKKRFSTKKIFHSKFPSFEIFTKLKLISPLIDYSVKIVNFYTFYWFQCSEFENKKEEWKRFIKVMQSFHINDEWYLIYIYGLKPQMFHWVHNETVWIHMWWKFLLVYSASLSSQPLVYRLIEVIEYDLPVKDIWYHGQLVTVTDCLYR